MNPLKEILESGQTILWIETQNTVAFLRPVPDILVWTPCPTAGVAQPLRFRQVGFTAPKGFPARRALGDVGPRPENSAIAGCTLYTLIYRVQALDSVVRHQQSILTPPSY